MAGSDHTRASAPRGIPGCTRRDTRPPSTRNGRAEHSGYLARSAAWPWRRLSHGWRPSLRRSRRTNAPLASESLPDLDHGLGQEEVEDQDGDGGDDDG